eukprot:1159504-Pelagomonas_calceolata.AAC.4
MATKRLHTASRILLEGISKGPLGAGLASMDIGSADHLALQNLQEKSAKGQPNQTKPTKGQPNSWSKEKSAKGQPIKEEEAKRFKRAANTVCQEGVNVGDKPAHIHLRILHSARP